jgi:hypothetical protein
MMDALAFLPVARIVHRSRSHSRQGRVRGETESRKTARALKGLGGLQDLGGSTSAGFAPGVKIHRVEAETEYVGWDKSELRSSEADETDDHAIHGRQNPTFPATLAYKNGRNDRKYAG